MRRVGANVVYPFVPINQLLSRSNQRTGKLPVRPYYYPRLSSLANLNDNPPTRSYSARRGANPPVDDAFVVVVIPISTDQCRVPKCGAVVIWDAFLSIMVGNKKREKRQSGGTEISEHGRIITPTVCVYR